MLKCSAAAHLIELFIPSYTCTLEKIRGSQGKGMKATQQAFFILIFMRGGQRNQTFTSFCEILTGETPLPAREEQGLPYQTAAKSAYTSLHTHLSTCLLSGTSHGKKSRVCGGHGTCRKLSPVPKTVGFIYEFEQRGLYCLIKCSLLVVASQP